MPGESIAPDPNPDRERVPRTRVGARDVGLGVFVFVATLALLVGVTRFFDSGGSAPSPSASGSIAAQPSAAATPTLTPAASASAAPPPASGIVATPSPSGDPVLVGAGDIGDCASVGDEDTATLLDDIEGTVFTTGDNAYESGTAAEFQDCYHPSWGRHRDRTRPAPGNHDWVTEDLAGYRGYFGEAAQGPDGSSWYSYDLGTWHVIVLDSACEMVGGCGPGSAQGEWLVDDLAASDATCTIAIFHTPRFSSGDHGDAPAMDAFWRPLHAAEVDVIVNGDDHDYERFAPQDPDGSEDRDRGIRQFVAGTGGAPLTGFPRTAPNSELRASVAHGVLAFTLRDGSYDWEFITARSDFSDRGTANCH